MWVEFRSQVIDILGLIFSKTKGSALCNFSKVIYRISLKIALILRSTFLKINMSAILLSCIIQILFWMDCLQLYNKVALILASIYPEINMSAMLLHYNFGIFGVIERFDSKLWIVFREITRMKFLEGDEETNMII